MIKLIEMTKMILTILLATGTFIAVVSIISRFLFIRKFEAAIKLLNMTGKDTRLDLETFKNLKATIKGRNARTILNGIVDNYSNSGVKFTFDNPLEDNIIKSLRMIGFLIIDLDYNVYSISWSEKENYVDLYKNKSKKK